MKIRKAVKILLIMLVSVALFSGCTTRFYTRQPARNYGGYGNHRNDRRNDRREDRREERHERNERQDQRYSRSYGY